jgi:multiple RNA-binding domain-containing protein 1
MADSSRIFIGNIPPNLKEDDFKKHFSQIASITDSKFIPKRRIGYVGYKTHDTALQAVKHFNKSFIRMSRINVELAKPVDEVKPRNKSTIDQPGLEPQGSKKDSSNDPKLQEFLNVMVPSSKSKTWANEDITTGNIPLPIVVDDQASDEEYQSLTKKRKRSDDDDQGEKQIRLLEPDQTLLSESKSNFEPEVGQVEAPETKESEGEGLIVEESTVEHPKAAVSDSDWLRSKTSRLLGLVDDEELDKIESQPNKSSIEHESEPTNFEALISTDDQTEIPKIPDPIEHSGTGRLFIRNLPYGATEDELQQHFSKHGTLEEVWIKSFLFLSQ